MVGANTAARVGGWRTPIVGLRALVPPFLRPGEDGVVAHFAALAAASPVPLIVYHVPYRTGQPLSASAIRGLAAIDGVAGIKLRGRRHRRRRRSTLMADPPPGFAVLAGDDVFLSPLLALGADGGILASAHVATGDSPSWRSSGGTVTRTGPGAGHRLAAPVGRAVRRAQPRGDQGGAARAGPHPDPGGHGCRCCRRPGQHRRGGPTPRGV